MSRSSKSLTSYTNFWTMNPKTWKYLVNIGLLLKYKTLNINKLPSSIQLPSSLNLHVNPNENRGRALLVSNGITQKQLLKFWVESVSSFYPSIVLDIGVNYGECLFSVQYPYSTKIFGIEANEQLFEYIMRTQSEHPNRFQMNILHAFASNQDQQSQDFFVDKNWSGTSSGRAIYPSMVEKKVVQTITVDTLLRNFDLEKERILFKIDVEGYEAFVVEGMQQVIREAKEMLGIIEFDNDYLERAGMKADMFLTRLSSLFKIYYFNKNGELQELSPHTYRQLQNRLHSSHIHMDLVLLKTSNHIPIINLLR
ncbi:FkbM family methyltransferase [Bacillus sp. BGMRC 2118]|nr:FkbM family methyltransferase [Bacillus sp. BGMRC 2118]